MLYVITSNDYKKEEIEKIFSGTNIDLTCVDIQLQEIMHLELEVIVRDKLLQAYREFGAPCAVEHGGIHIDALERLPGGISKVVWDQVGEKICKFIPPGEARTAIAKSVVGYCDGKNIHLFDGETSGTIADVAKGNRKFQWDPIFIPYGSIQTFAELGIEDKQEFSQATKAWNKLIEHLAKTDR